MDNDISKAPAFSLGDEVTVIFEQRGGYGPMRYKAIIASSEGKTIPQDHVPVKLISFRGHNLPQGSVIDRVAWLPGEGRRRDGKLRAGHWYLEL